MSTKSPSPLTYKDAGVDIDAGEELVERIKPMAASTKRPGSDASLGGFGGLFGLKAAGDTDPILVAASDGVGTKLKVAIETGIHNTVGIDLVAMCVNDLVVQGAEPLLFLDYFATGKLDVDAGADIVSGIAEGCRQSGCVLVGGETAEMPGMYKAGDYDLAGFSVGAMERDGGVDLSTVGAGDVLIGLASTGVHSNGFSLVRKLLEVNNVSYSDTCVFDNSKTVGEVLIAPTKIYVKSLVSGLKLGLVKAMAHITGGGLLENIPRSLPDGIMAKLDAASWPMHPTINWLRELGGLDAREVARTFNCGIGMVVIVPADKADAALKHFNDNGEDAYRIGVLAPCDGKPYVDIDMAAGQWGLTEATVVSGRDG